MSSSSSCSLTMSVARLTPLLFFVAFLLLLLVSLSVPIIKSIDLLKLTATLSEGFSVVSIDASGNVKFGVWGYCISSVEAEAAGQSINKAGECSKPHLGYTLNSNVENALQVVGISDTLSRSVTSVLVLHPIACGLTFLGLVLSLFILLQPASRARLCSSVTLIVSILASVLTTIVFLIDVIFVAVVQHKLKNATKGDVKATWGSGTWMILAAAVLLWAACFGACCGIFATRGRRRKQDTEKF
ncbi:pali-domain-containing protein [Phellopilus nigrolimitatus]|nr:pali-domain-containing protein [Phellopilus nigrolimitatus]